MSSENLNVLDLKSPSIRALHLSWVAFFITFVVWFSHAPMMAFIREAFELNSAEVKALLILNVAMTIPARILIGILVDKFGPRIVYSILLVSGGLVSLGFAFAETYEQLALFRFLLGFIGAGFVIGIRMVSEWFPAKTVGLAEGVYGGWGNFGSAAGAMTLPTLALLFGGEDGWRYALASVGCIAVVYGFFYYWRARNTPKGSTYFKPKKSGGLEVSSVKDFYFYLLMNIPMYLALAVLTWKLASGVKLITLDQANYIYLGLVALAIFQFSQIYKVNKHIFTEPVPEMFRYKFKQVAILDVAYFVTFGSELAVVSMLPLFFMDTFSLGAVEAGFLASGFAFMNLVARPGGGWLSDRFGRRKTMLILIAGLTVGYLILSQITSEWWLPGVVIATMACSFFVQAGEGAVFAMVPLIQRRMTGQIAGMAGAYGNVGGVIFLTVLSFVDTPTFFMVIAGSAMAIFCLVMFLEEPSGHMHEVLPDGTVEMIEVS